MSESDTLGHEPALVARTCSPAKLLGFLKFVGTPRCNDSRRCHPCGWHSQGASAASGGEASSPLMRGLADEDFIDAWCWQKFASATLPAGFFRALAATLRQRRSFSRHHADFAGESCRAPIEAHLAFQLASNHALYCAHAEALARGWFNGRAVLLSPAQDEPSVRLARPLDLNVPTGALISPR
jgi:hypothetical protein